MSVIPWMFLTIINSTSHRDEASDEVRLSSESQRIIERWRWEEELMEQERRKREQDPMYVYYRTKRKIIHEERTRCFRRVCRIVDSKFSRNIDSRIKKVNDKCEKRIKSRLNRARAKARRAGAKEDEVMKKV